MDYNEYLKQSQPFDEERGGEEELSNRDAAYQQYRQQSAPEDAPYTPPTIGEPEKEEPSAWRQIQYGFDAGDNLVTDALDLIEIHFGDGDGYATPADWSKMTKEERRQRVISVDEEKLEREYQDILSQGYDDSWAAFVGKAGKFLADPTMLLPGGAMVKGAYGAGKAARLATKAGSLGKTVYKYHKPMAFGGAYGGAANIVDQLKNEGQVNKMEVALITAGTAIASPLLVAGVNKAGVAIGKAKHNRVMKTAATTPVRRLTKKQLIRTHNQIVDDLIEGQTTVNPTDLFDERVIAMPEHLRTKEVSRIVSERYKKVMLDNPEKFQAATGVGIPSIEKETAIHINKVRKYGATEWRKNFTKAHIRKATPEKTPKGAFLDRMEWIAGGVDTRIGWLAPKVKGKVTRSDQAVLKRTHDAEQVLDDVFGTANIFKGRTGAIGKVFRDKQARTNFEYLMFDQKWDDVAEAINTSSADGVAKQQLRDAIRVMRENVEFVGRDAIDTGLIGKGGKRKPKLVPGETRVAGKPSYKMKTGDAEHTLKKASTPQAQYRKGFFGHRVEDLEGLKKAMGDMGQESYLDDARDIIREQLELPKGAVLEEFYERQAVQKAIRMANAPRLVKRPDGSYARKFQVVPKWARKYYHTPEDGMRMYMREMIEEVETRKLLGITSKDKEWFSKATAMKLQNKDSMLGALLESSDNLSAAQQDELFNLLNVRFGPGRRHSARWVSNAKSVVYGALLGNVVAGAQQVGDLGVSLVVNGYMPTLQAIAHRSGAAVKRGAGKLAGKQMKTHFNVMEEGVASAAHDIATGGLHRNLTRVMKYSGFTGTDRVMKNITSEAAVIKAMKQVKKQGGSNKIYQKYGQYWGNDDTMELIGDLRTWKRGQEFTPRMKEYAVTELMELQPVAKSALPQAYLEHPDGRLLYTLMTWQLRFLDLGRRRAMEHINKGGVANITKGVGALGYLGLTVGSMDAGIDYAQDWMKGRETKVEDFPIHVAESTLSLFMLNRYGMNRAKGPVSYAIGEMSPSAFGGVGDVLLSPATEALQEGIKPEGDALEGAKEGFRQWSRFTPGLGQTAVPVTQFMLGKGYQDPYSKQTEARGALYSIFKDKNSRSSRGGRSRSNRTRGPN